MPKYDLDQIEKCMRASNSQLDKDGDGLIPIQNRGGEFEIAFTLWLYAEHNRNTNPCEFSKAFGGMVGACLRNYLDGYPSILQAHHADHFFTALQNVVNGTDMETLGTVDFAEIPDNSNLH